jgi:secreted Zn-dependent insulinase-like peptidase
MGIGRRLGLLLVALLLGACAEAPAPVPQAAPQQVLRSDLDTREYRHLQLPNRLNVLLVSDPSADKAAASLRVETGSGDDPRDRQGLAHFLEHMLFLGTAKYPDPAEYQAFVNAHGGSHNAYTAVDHTLYFLEIEPGSLEPALDRFAQFFVAPLFNPEYVQREANAVDSEYRMGLKDDSRREYDVLRELVQPDHPLASLAVGNLETLGPQRGDLRAELLDFHRRHYSANLMTLVVIGRESPDALEALVRGRFGAIADRGAEARASAPALFAPGTLPLEVRIRPVKEVHELSLAFPVPSARARYAAKPLEYIANLLGHEGPGSLLSALKARGWAEGLSASAGFDQFGQDIFQVSVKLTEAGTSRVDEIVALVFQGIELLRREGVERWRYEEQARLASLGFRFREKGEATSTAIQLANALRDYPAAEAQRGPWLFADFDATLIGDYLGRLRPDNLLLTLSHPDAATERESRWFGTPYAVQKLDAKALERRVAAAGELSLPPPNEFIPERVATRRADGDAQRPQLLVQDPAFRLWHYQDPKFASPKASLYFQLLAPRALDSARDAALATLFTRLVQDDLNALAYPATLAGLQYAIAPSARGLSVRISGWDDRQGQLLGHVLAALDKRRFPEARFAGIKSELLRELGNSRRDRPYTQLAEALQNALVRNSWPDETLAAALDGVGPADLERWLAGLREGAAIEVLAHGNFLPDEALALGERIRGGLRVSGTPAAPAIEVRELAAGEAGAMRPIDHPDSAAILYLQGRATDRAERARIALAGQMLSSAFFDELRTERQLGYAVFLQPMPLARVPGLLLAVQSPVAGPAALVREYDAFLARHAGELAAMPAADFERHKAALIARLKEAPGSLGEKTERLWSDLELGSLGFDDREQVAAEVARIDQAGWLAFYRERIAGPERRALLLYSRGSAHAPGTAAGLERLAPLGAGAKYYRFDWPSPVQLAGPALHL